MSGLCSRLLLQHVSIQNTCVWCSSVVCEWPVLSALITACVYPEHMCMMLLCSVWVACALGSYYSMCLSRTCVWCSSVVCVLCSRLLLQHVSIQNTCVWCSSVVCEWPVLSALITACVYPEHMCMMLLCSVWVACALGSYYSMCLSRTCVWCSSVVCECPVLSALITACVYPEHMCMMLLCSVCVSCALGSYYSMCLSRTHVYDAPL